jgi:hypothetical protein
MITRKLKNFEYAGFVDQGVSGELKIHHQDSFDTPNGFVMVVAGSESMQEGGQQRAELTVGRIRYYLENDLVEDPAEAARNALIYANGYLFEKYCREDEDRRLPLSCLCLLIKDQKVHYSWAGSVCMKLLAGKKLVPLVASDVDLQGDNNQHAEFLGVQKILAPASCMSALSPVDGDMLLLGTSPMCKYLKDKAIRKVLLDSMPVQTKLARLGKIISESGNTDQVALQLLSFYNINNTERLYSPVAGIAPFPSAKSGSKVALYRRGNFLKIAGAVFALIIISYMVYDLFLFEPQPAHRIITVDPVDPPEPVIEDTLVVAEQDQPEETQGEFPDDVPYRVRTGDSWGRIYQRFEVCSWFIRNHPPNIGKVQNQPVAGVELMIPVRFSANESWNPRYYTHFTLDKVGGSCENANEEFLEKFYRNLD